LLRPLGVTAQLGGQKTLFRFLFQACVDNSNINLFKLMPRTLAMFLSLSAISSGNRMDKVVMILVTSISVPG
jgi:hypothetical protein